MTTNTIRGMKRFLIYITVVMLLAACNSDSKIAGRAQELCRHLPVPDQLEQSRNYLTEDFYAVLDTMFNLPDTSEVLHEWEFWFCAADGTPVARCSTEVQAVEQTDAMHATVTVLVHPEDPDYTADEHTLCIELVEGAWLISDFDNRLADCIRYTKNARNAVEL